MRSLGAPKIKRDQRGPKNSTWKGGAAGYQALHVRVRVERGAPSECSCCGRSDVPCEWANLTGRYEDTADYAELNHDGKAYSITINQALVRKMNCRWFESGILNLSMEGLPDITLDYGSNGRDANATVNVLGQTYPVILQ